MIDQKFQSLMNFTLNKYLMKFFILKYQKSCFLSKSNYLSANIHAIRKLNFKLKYHKDQ